MSTLTSTRPAWVARAGAALTRREWVSVGGMGLFVAALHVVGWGVLVGIVAPAHYQVSSGQVVVEPPSMLFSIIAVKK